MRVRARGRHGQQVAAAQVGRQVHVADQDVAGLAVLAHHAGEHRLGLRGAARGDGGVVGVVEHGTRVVGHAAVHGDVAAGRGAAVGGVHVHGLGHPDRVEGQPRGARDGPPRLERDARARQAEALDGLLDVVGEGVGDLRGRARLVHGRVGDAVAAAEVELGQLHPVLGLDLGEELEHASGRQPEALGLEDLGPDVAVHAQQVDRLGRQGRGHGDGGRRAAGHIAVPVGGGRGQGEPELLVLVRGGDEVVGVRVHARGQPEHHGGAAAGLGRERGQVGELVERVHDDPAHARLEGGAQLGVRLVVAVQADVGRVDAGGQRDRQLAAGGGVHAQALLGRPAGGGEGEHGLAGVVDVRSPAQVGERGVEALAERAGAGAEVVLVHHEQRRAELRGERARAQALDGELAVGGAVHAGGPQAGHERVRVPRRRKPGGRERGGGGGLRRPHPGAHIFSGAVTPSRPRPLASTWAVASLSHRRVRLRVSTGRGVPSSVGMGTIRQAAYHEW